MMKIAAIQFFKRSWKATTWFPCMLQLPFTLKDFKCYEMLMAIKYMETRDLGVEAERNISQRTCYI